MTREQANTVTPGTTVSFGGQVHTVESISERGVAAPYFRLSGDGQLTSYQACSLVQTDPLTEAADAVTHVHSLASSATYVAGWQSPFVDNA